MKNSIMDIINNEFEQIETMFDDEEELMNMPIDKFNRAMNIRKARTDSMKNVLDAYDLQLSWINMVAEHTDWNPDVEAINEHIGLKKKPRVEQTFMLGSGNGKKTFK